MEITMKFNPATLALVTLLSGALASSASIASSTYPKANSISYAPSIATIVVGAPLVLEAPRAFCAKMFRFCMAGNQNACQNYHRHCFGDDGGIGVIGGNP
jgi:hypothetical protein